MDVAYYPTEPGEYAVHVLCNQEDIPKSPYMADIKPAPPGLDPTKVRNTHPRFHLYTTAFLLTNCVYLMLVCHMILRHRS